MSETVQLLTLSLYYQGDSKAESFLNMSSDAMGWETWEIRCIKENFAQIHVNFQFSCRDHDVILFLQHQNSKWTPT